MTGAQLRGRGPHSPQCLLHRSCRCASGLRREQDVPCLLKRRHGFYVSLHLVCYVLGHHTNRLTKCIVCSKNIPAHESAGAWDPCRVQRA